MNVEQLQRIVEIRRSRAQSVEQEVVVRRQACDAAQAVLDASLARQQALQADLQLRTDSLEDRRLHGGEPVATLMRLEDYIRAQRLVLAREEVVGGRAASVVAERQGELEQSMLRLWRERQRLEHCESLVRRGLQRRRLRLELKHESSTPTRPLRLS